MAAWSNLGNALLSGGDAEAAAGAYGRALGIDPDNAEVYYNLGTWISTLVAPEGKEKQIEAFPFLLVYIGRDGRRVEEYYIVYRDPPGAAPRAVLQTLRTEFPNNAQIQRRLDALK